MQTTAAMWTLFFLGLATACGTDGASGTSGAAGNQSSGGDAGSAGSGAGGSGAQAGTAGGGAQGGSAGAQGGTAGGGAQGGSAGSATGGSGGSCTAPNTQCGDDCLDLQADLDNCGACGSPCLTGVCAGTCTPPLDTGYYTGNIDNGLVADDTRAAWLLQSGSEWAVHAMRHTDANWTALGNVVTPTYSGLVSATLALTASEVLVLVDDQPNARILSFPVDGGNPTEVASSQHEYGVDNDGLGVARSSEYLVWLVGRGIHRMKAGQSEELWYQSYALSDLTLDGEQVWWKNGAPWPANYSILTLPVTAAALTSTPQVFATGVIGSFTVAGDYVYFPREDGIYRKPKLGGAEVLVTPQTDVYFRRITSDDLNLYWTWLFKTSGNPLPLYTAPFSALATPRVAASHDSQTEGIAAGGGMLYWSDGSSQVYRAARP